MDKYVNSNTSNWTEWGQEPHSIGRRKAEYIFPFANDDERLKNEKIQLIIQYPSKSPD